MKDIRLEKQLPVITMNFDEVKVNLQENLSRYEGIVVTEDSLKDCKATQRDLATLRTKLDTYRKDVKKEMSKPIKDFEDQCKELIGLIDSVENPIKQGILKFDNEVRDRKRVRAEEIIANVVITKKLDKKYAEQLTVLDKYTNLSATDKSVVEDINNRADALKTQQHMEKCKLEILKSSIESTIETVNTTLSTPLKSEDFEKYIDMGWDAGQIIREINDRARLIREAEKPKEIVQEVKEEPKVITPEAPRVETIEKWYVDIKVIHDKDKIQALSQFLKVNGYEYEVRSKGKV